MKIREKRRSVSWGIALVLLALTVCFFANTFTATAAEVTPRDIARGSKLTEVLDRGVLRVGLLAQYPPFDMMDKNGEIFGFDIDIDKMMAKELGVELELVNTAWDGIIDTLYTGKTDILIIGMTRTLKRMLRVSFTDPYFVHGQRLGVNKARKPNITSWDQLDKPGNIITVMLGTTGDFAATEMFKKATIRRFESAPEMIMEAVRGRADAFQWDEPQVAIHVGRNKDKIYMVDVPGHREEMAFAIQRGDPDFLNWLNFFIYELKRKGTLDQLYEKWFINAHEWQDRLPK
jgi:polar amino acid transport system substrate-binding protein